MSDKVRIHEIAKELGIPSKDVVDKVVAIGIDAKTASSSVSMEEAEKIMNFIMSGAQVESKPKPKLKKKSAPNDSTQEAAPKEQQERASEPTPAKEPESDVAVVKASEPAAADEPKSVNESKEEPKSGPKTSVRPALKKKGSGLKIVKKKRPQEQKVETSVNKPESLSSYGKMSEEAKAELANKKKKSEKSQPSAKKEHGKKIDIFGGDMGEVSMDYEEDQVVLLDINDQEKRVDSAEEEVRKPRPKKPQGRNANKKGGGGKRQVARQKRVKHRKVKEDDVKITHIEIPEECRVYEFAEKLQAPISDVIKVLFNLGLMVTKNDFLGKDEIEILAEEFDVEVSTIDPTKAFDYEEQYHDEHDGIELEERPPVITIMGHVDHGKTSLLDAIRNAKVAEAEAGGITQHIGAYTIDQHGKKITFIDTPGHAAFSAMRQRGADITDIIIIVVAADDGVKPQTIEAIKLVKESGAPVIVAVNKMDKEGANPDLVKGQMAEHDLSPTDWGGDTEFIPMSAKKGEGIDDLLENILIQAELLELQADPNAKAKAVVVESSLEKGRGPVATVIVQNGTLHVGDTVVCGSAFGRVRALVDNHKKQIKQIGLSETAVVVGLNEVPGSGETMVAMDNEKEAREFAQKRSEYERQKELSHSTKTTLDELTSLIAEGRLKTLKVVLKTDVHGSLEAIKSSLSELRNDEVKVEIISSGVGGITENDVELVNNSDNCVLIGFNTRPTGGVKAAAKQKNVEIHTYTVIYQLIDDITGMLTGMMSPKYTEEHSGQASVKEVFKIPKGVVAGCLVEDGKLTRGELVRVIRDGVVVFEGALDSLKRFKDDVKEVGNGYECGVVINGYEDVVVGDVIETFIKVEQQVAL